MRKLYGVEEENENLYETTNRPPKNELQWSSGTDMADRRVALEVVVDLAVDYFLVDGCVRTTWWIFIADIHLPPRTQLSMRSESPAARVTLDAGPAEHADSSKHIKEIENV